MGQKVNPIGFRLSVRRDWKSRWFASKKEFPNLIAEDYKIRKYLRRNFVTLLFLVFQSNVHPIVFV